MYVHVTTRLFLRYFYSLEEEKKYIYYYYYIVFFTLYMLLKILLRLSVSYFGDLEFIQTICLLFCRT